MVILVLQYFCKVVNHLTSLYIFGDFLLAYESDLNRNLETEYCETSFAFIDGNVSFKSLRNGATAS